MAVPSRHPHDTSRPPKFDHCKNSDTRKRKTANQNKTRQQTLKTRAEGVPLASNTASLLWTSSAGKSTFVHMEPPTMSSQSETADRGNVSRIRFTRPSLPWLNFTSTPPSPSILATDSILDSEFPRTLRIADTYVLEAGMWSVLSSDKM